MTEAPLNHPNDEVLRALSLGQLAEAELAHVSTHLGDCPACCRRIDLLANEDPLLVRLQQGAASREKVLVSPAQRRAAVRALRQSHESSSAMRKRDPETVPSSGIAHAAAAETHRDVPSVKGVSAELTRFLAAPGRPDEIGRLGPYRILAVLGQGGMGIVFRAHDPALDRLVALKAMLPAMAGVPTAKERFLREARAAAALKHPHVVTIFQVGEDRGAPFLAMELLEGEPLADRIRREGRLPLAEVLRIGRETAMGLAAAHARGLVHRDIKSANLWLEGPTGQVKILDFGLARAQADQTQLTQWGLIVGTPAYMAPEQAEGKPVDQRCDLFSLGCVLYEMCAGTPPFHRETTIAVLRALALHEPPLVGELRLDAPPEMSALVGRLLAKKPEDRPASAQEVAATLALVEGGGKRGEGKEHSPRATRHPPPVTRHLLVASAALAVVLALTLILWPTPRGIVRIESDDPAVEIVFDKNGPTIKGADQTPITLRAGEHGILIKRGDFTFEADKLLLKKGAALTLKVELLKGKIQVLQGGQVVAAQEMPLLAAPLPARTPFDAQQARDHQQAWAKYLGVPVEYTNKSGMKFRLIPPGEFTMGFTEGDAAGWEKFGSYQDNLAMMVPAHPVRLTQPFYLGEREVRYGEFFDLMKRNPGDQPKPPPDGPDGALLDSCTWFDCVEFCNRLSERDGLTPAYKVEEQKVTVNPDATGYRLPTEAEWEFACRAGTSSLWYFPWTAKEAQATCERNVQEAEAYLRVRTTAPNPFGLVGMYAGASEWCWDWYDPGYYQKCADRGVAVDPQGPDSGEARITRGGSCYEHASGHLTHSNSAGRVPKKSQNFNDGFGRVVLPIPAKGQLGAAGLTPPPARAPFNTQQARDHQQAWAKHCGVPVEKTNSLGMKFRLIPPGEFTMGVTDAEAEAWTKFHQDYQEGGKRAAPAHPVRLTRPFYLAEREVRYGEFLDLMKREPGDLPKHPHHNAEGVLLANCTWFDCVEFCNRLSERDGLTPAYKVEEQKVTVNPDATGYRLPTEAEWEFACRAGTTSLWYFGLTAQQARAMCDRSVPEGQVYLRARVAAPNPFGLVGMYAGASEWCWDWYDPGYYQKCADGGVAVDPQGPDTGQRRIIRGGTGYSIGSGDLASVNSAARDLQYPIKAPSFEWNGFGRVVLPIPLPAADRGAALAGWHQEVAALPAEEQVKAVAAKLKDLNPGFDGQVTPHIVGGVVVQLTFRTDHVATITPLRALTGMTNLYCVGSNWAQGKITNLEPLRGMRLTRLSIFANRGVTDLSPLAGMKLTSLDCSGTLVTDLEPLRGMPLEDLNCRECPGIPSLAPLQGMPLKRLDCSRAHVSDLTPLRGMPLDFLAFSCTQVADLTPLRGMKLAILGCKETKVTDLSVLRGMPLKVLWCDFQAERDAAVLRSVESLERIDDKPVAEFWNEVDVNSAPRKP